MRIWNLWDSILAVFLETESPGARLRALIAERRPLQLVGAVNPFSALLAERAGHRALYLSGAGVANASHALPDLGITSLQDVCEDVRRITAASDLPLLVDADTGWGGAFNIERTVSELIRAGAAGMHIEDQQMQKRCGHRPNKEVVSTDEMVARITTAVAARGDPGFVIMARTDAVAVEGMDAALGRAQAYVEAGADAVFPEAMGALQDYTRFVEALPVPVLANITEFGLTPMFSTEQLASVGVAMALYPLSAFRAMSRAAQRVYEEIHQSGTQAAVIELMQTRDELYDVLGYREYEQRLDRLAVEE